MSLSYFLFAAAPIKDDQQHLIFLMDFCEIENGVGAGATELKINASCFSFNTFSRDLCCTAMFTPPLSASFTIRKKSKKIRWCGAARGGPHLIM